MRKYLFLLFLLLPVLGFSQDIGDYLTLNDIGGYKFRPKPTKRIFGNSGVLISAGHFDLDHDDTTYETRYILPEPLLGAEVKVTQHAGGDSDKWLFHEIDRDFRNYFGLPGDSYVIRIIDANTIMAAGSGGWTYRWLSGNKVIHIEYTDLQMEKPEPLEVVKAYLAKHPSSLPLMTSTDLRTHENETKWVKDEMDRRLWLCDKWFLHLQMAKAEENETLRSVVKYLAVFVDYREKYYGIKGQDEKSALSRYLTAKDGTSIKSKLSEYKTWWSVNKTKSINLP